MYIKLQKMYLQTSFPRRFKRICTDQITRRRRDSKFILFNNYSLWGLNFSEILYEKFPYGTDLEQDNGICYALNKRIILVGNRLNTVSNFILNHNRHKENLIKKYYSYTKEEEMAIFSRENRVDPQPEIWKLSFHIENRRKSKELGIEIPLFLNELGK